MLELLKGRIYDTANRSATDSGRDVRSILFKLPRKLRKLKLRVLLWTITHDENFWVNFFATALRLDGYAAFHYFHEEHRSWQRDLDGRALAPPGELGVTLNKDAIAGGHYNLKTGHIDYNPARWLWWAETWRKNWGVPPPGLIIDETEFAFLTTCYTLQHTVIHEILHKFVEAENTETPSWLKECIDNLPANDSTIRDIRCFSRDYEESNVQSFTDDLFGSWESMLTLLMIQLLVASGP